MPGQCYPDHGDDSDTPIKSADLALYEAKRTGKNVYRISGALTHRRSRGQHNPPSFSARLPY
jgi:predicted signal transduction protein with EAL and GGDEF domain